VLRLIVFAVLCFIAYRLFTRAVRPPDRVDRGTGGEISDVMAQDPYCKVYFPRHEGVALRWQGRDIHFCSTDCRDRFVASNGGSADEHSA
jgi:hypothetical protein